LRRNDEVYGRKLNPGGTADLAKTCFATGEIEKMLGRFERVPQEVLASVRIRPASMGVRLFEQ